MSLFNTNGRKFRPCRVLQTDTQQLLFSPQADRLHYWYNNAIPYLMLGLIKQIKLRLDRQFHSN